MPTRTKRKKRGATLMGEFGPALYVLLIAIFFPLIDLLSVCLAYGLCMVLNNNQIHEASLVPYEDAGDPSGSVQKGIVDQWLNGMGHFVKIKAYPHTTVSYRDGQSSTDAGSSKIVDKVVRVSTEVICQPFLPIPLMVANIPGINAPMNFTVSAERQMENPDNAPQK